ncbi:DNA repair protein RecN [bacterium]|nr:DNA repair protein RecN [bacterium]
MLTLLYIKNFALIEEAEITFENGLNIITGETGAGKSILIGALSLILGERASTDSIRTGSERAIIEGHFQITKNAKLKKFIREQDIEISDDSIVLRREISAKGQSRCFVNDNLITNSVLNSIGDLLVDLHGQHEHQYLLRQEVHIDILDEFARLEVSANEVADQYKKISDLNKKIQEISSQKESYKEKHEIYSHQLKEITDVAPEPNEDEQLLQEEKISGNSERLFELTKKIFDILYEAENAMIGNLASIENDFNELKSIDSKFSDVAEQFQTAKITIEETARWIGDYNHHISFDPERLEAIRERLSKIQRLKKKYGSIEDVLLKKTELEEQINLSENFDAELQKLMQQLQKDVQLYIEKALDISQARKKAANKLEKLVVDEMKKLGMENAVFNVHIDTITDSQSIVKIKGEPIKATSKGIDHVEFFLSTNLGENPKPLIKVASGGEISRIMLSLKTALAESDQIPTLIFDEIDVGISGRVAQSVGKALYALAQSHQTICITHLPQIASMSQCHFSVHKSTHGNKTQTRITKLNAEQKIHEVAKLLGGETVTEATLENARELVDAVK